MRTLFIINAVGLYFNFALIFMTYVGRDQPMPFAHDTDPERIRFDMYIDFVPFAVFAVLGCVSLWQGTGWSRLRLAYIIVPPMVIGSVTYAGWWMGMI